MLALHPLTRVRSCREFYHGPGGAVGTAAHSSLTVRDAIAWADFCGSAVGSGQLSVWEAYAHGAYLTLFDGLGLGLGIPEATAKQLRATCEAFLRTQLPPAAHAALLGASFKTLPAELGAADGADDASVDTFGAGPFRVLKARPPPARVLSGCARPMRAVWLRNDDAHERAPTDWQPG